MRRISFLRQSKNGFNGLSGFLRQPPRVFWGLGFLKKSVPSFNKLLGSVFFFELLHAHLGFSRVITEGILERRWWVRAGVISVTFAL